MADALDPADPADPADPIHRLNPPAPMRRRRVTAPPVGAASRAGRGAAGPRPHSPRPPRGPARTARAASRAGLTPVPVPTTVWTLPIPGDTVATALRPGTYQAAHTGLPDRIQRVLTAFAHPANTLILAGPADDGSTGPGTATHGGHNGLHAGWVIGRDDGDPRASGHRSPSDHQTAGGAQLIVLDLGCRRLDERSAAAVAADLAAGGTLAVLSHSHRTGGRLLDPTGAVIAALQDADLLYLQHIVIVEHPLRPQPEHTRPEHTRPEHTRPEHTWPEHTWPEHARPTVTVTAVMQPGATQPVATRPGRGLVDLTLFLRPGAAV